MTDVASVLSKAALIAGAASKLPGKIGVAAGLGSLALDLASVVARAFDGEPERIERITTSRDLLREAVREIGTTKSPTKKPLANNDWFFDELDRVLADERAPG